MAIDDELDALRRENAELRAALRRLSRVGAHVAPADAAGVLKWLSALFGGEEAAAEPEEPPTPPPVASQSWCRHTREYERVDRRLKWPNLAPVDKIEGPRVVQGD